MATASSCWSAASMRSSPSMLMSWRGAPNRERPGRQHGRPQRRGSFFGNRRRMLWPVPHVAEPGARSASRRRRPACGWDGSGAIASGRSRSSPGSTTRPCGTRITTRKSRATAGMRRWCRLSRSVPPAASVPRPRPALPGVPPVGQPGSSDPVPPAIPARRGSRCRGTRACAANGGVLRIGGTGQAGGQVNALAFRLVHEVRQFCGEAPRAIG